MISRAGFRKARITILSEGCAHTFNRLLDHIEKSNHELRLVTDSVAHDLKSPVTAIRGNLEVALSGGKNSGPGASRWPRRWKGSTGFKLCRDFEYRA